MKILNKRKIKNENVEQLKGLVTANISKVLEVDDFITSLSTDFFSYLKPLGFTVGNLESYSSKLASVREVLDEIKQGLDGKLEGKKRDLSKKKLLKEAEIYKDEGDQAKFAYVIDSLEAIIPDFSDISTDYSHVSDIDLAPHFEATKEALDAVQTLMDFLESSE